jgi:hypothetical protein
MEVPVLDSYPSPGTEEFMFVPGARRDRKEAEFEPVVGSEYIVSSFVVLPTLIALEIQAGLPIESVKAALPEAITVAIPADLRLSIISLWGSLSQLLKYCPPPRLIFTEAKL